MFRPFIGSSSGPIEIQIQELSAFLMHYGIPHAYWIKFRIMRYMSTRVPHNFYFSRQYDRYY